MRKKGHAAGISFVALITIGLVAAGLGTVSWTVATIVRNETETTGEFCTVTRQMGLFRLTDTSSTSCRSNRGETKSYQVMCPELVVFNEGLQISVIAFCALSMLMCLIIMSIAAFNICENPYQTYLSAFGLAIYNGIGLACSLLAVILYVSLLYTDLQEPLNPTRPGNATCSMDGRAPSNVYVDQDFEVSEPGYFGFSFFLVMSSIFTYIIGIVVSVLAEKKPIEKIKGAIKQKKDVVNNPKMEDIMIF